ncbi:MAG TPA: hypothetical protein VK454_10200 [Myxococcaceae bacterium]|nr:hypothetical protein [Myxococcaceae bacterium]
MVLATLGLASPPAKAQSLPEQKLPSQSPPSGQDLPQQTLPSQGQLPSQTLPSQSLPSQGQLPSQALPSQDLPSQGKLPSQSLPSQTLPTQASPKAPGSAGAPIVSGTSVKLKVGESKVLNVGLSIGLVCDDGTIVQADLETASDKENHLVLTGLKPGKTKCRAGTANVASSKVVNITVVPKSPPAD